MMKIRVNLTGMPMMKIEGILEVSGIAAPIVAKKIIEEFLQTKEEQKLKGTVEKM